MGAVIGGHGMILILILTELCFTSAWDMVVCSNAHVQIVRVCLLNRIELN